MTDILRVNGIQVSWHETSFRINGLPYYGILALDYEQKRERKIVYGSKRNGLPLGRTAGKVSFTASMKMLRASADQLTTMLTPLGAGSYGDANFIISVQYIIPVLPGNPPQPPITVILTDCTIDDKKDSNAEGVDEAVSEIELGVLGITENGKSIASLVRSIP